MRTIRILYISPIPPPSGVPAGGISTWTKQVLTSKYSELYSLDVVNTKVIGKRLKQLYSKKSFYEEIKRTKRILSDLSCKIKTFKPDIVHLNSSCSMLGMLRDIFCIMLCRRIKVVIHFHCDISYMIRNRVSKLLLKELVSRADNILTLNTSSKHFLLKNYNKESTILPNFLSNKFRKIILVEKCIRESVSTVIYVGHIVKSKGCDLIINLAGHYPQIQFVLVGHVSDEFVQIKKSNNVTIFGEVNQQQVIEQINKSDIFIFPTQSEGFPMAMLEAMACGLPILTTTVGAIPDMIEKYGGKMLPVNDEKRFHQALNELIRNKKIRYSMSIWNKNKVLSNYTEEIVLSKLFNIYEEMIKK